MGIGQQLPFREKWPGGSVTDAKDFEIISEDDNKEDGDGWWHYCHHHHHY
jgi:hypothetical protein